MPKPTFSIRFAALFAVGAALACSPAIADNNNLPTSIPGVGTYSGDLAARQFRGNGIYFSYDGPDRCYCQRPEDGSTASRPGARIINMEAAENAVVGDEEAPETAQRSNARIIDMEDAQSSMDCNNPGGVCVIRP